MFGASAPKLTRLIIDELKLEQAITAGEKERETVWEVTQLSPDEQVQILYFLTRTNSKV